MAPLETIGLFGFAWTSLGPPHVHWIAPMIFSALVGIANYAIYMGTIDYMIAAYGPVRILSPHQPIPVLLSRNMNCRHRHSIRQKIVWRSSPLFFFFFCSFLPFSSLVHSSESKLTRSLV